MTTSAKEQRSHVTISQKQLTEVLKRNIANFDDETWRVPDDEVVVKKYVDFFQEVAEHTCRLNQTNLKVVVKDSFGKSDKEANLIAASLVSALKHCYTVGSRCTTGERISLEVLNVIKSFDPEKACSKLRAFLKTLYPGVPDSWKDPQKVKKEIKKEIVEKKTITPCSSEWTSPTKIYKLWHGHSPKKTCKRELEVR